MLPWVVLHGIAKPLGGGWPMTIAFRKCDLDWARRHLKNQGDSDIFPTPFEMEAMFYNWKELSRQIARLDLSTYQWKHGRRFLIPAAPLRYRIATQLDPLDSVIMTAIVKRHGTKIEKHRVAIEENRVYSHRFNPLKDGRLYGNKSLWTDFWRNSRDKALSSTSTHILLADITDYYNQIYHHVLENELADAGLPQHICKTIQNFVQSQTDKVSRGIPVGPHFAHLFAELALNPVDRGLLAGGFDFFRYSDDFHIFCASQSDAEVKLLRLAEALDKHQRLTLQHRKTRICTAEEFVEIAEEKLNQSPISKSESALIQIISSIPSDDLYFFDADLSEISDHDLKSISPDDLAYIIASYLEQEPPNYGRLRWAFRRLSQLKLPGALEYAVTNIAFLLPVLGDVARYVMRAAPNFQNSEQELGQHVINALRNPVVAANEYISVVLVNLLARARSLNHIEAVTAMYHNVTPNVKREIILAACNANLRHWLKERKEDYHSGDPWLRRAVLVSLKLLPGDEGEFWFKTLKNQMTGLEKYVSRYVLQDRELKVGQIFLH
jgi:hypothetical protein